MSITWTEHPEMVDGVPTITLMARAHGRTIVARYQPKHPDAMRIKERAVSAMELFLGDGPRSRDVKTQVPAYDALAPGVTYELKLGMGRFLSKLTPVRGSFQV